jgi:hypothetical protein
MKTTLARLRPLISNPDFLLLLLISINLLVGAATAADYGESWDEHLRYQYAEQSLAAYSGDVGGLKDEKGSFYVMVGKLGSDVLGFLRKDWRPIEAWHYMNFLTFQLGLFFLYRLGKRVIGKWAAFATVLLFATQPLLWGHAFINPKDIPFMVFFLGSVELGLSMVDALAKSENTQLRDGGKSREVQNLLVGVFSQEWRTLIGKKKIILFVASGLSLGLLILLILFRNYLTTWMGQVVYQAYYAGPDSLLGRAFSSLAENRETLPVGNYVQKIAALYPRFGAIFALVLIGAVLLIALRIFPRTGDWVLRNQIRPVFKSCLHSFATKHVWIAGAFLGFASSIRVLGPFSGALVAGYFLLRRGRKALPVLVTYLVVGMVTTYLTWPNLWGAPLSRYLESLAQVSDFSWDGKVMFAGVDYAVGELPRQYLPVLLSIQFSEVALVLFAIGVAITLVGFMRGTLDRRMIMLLAAWGFLPLFAAIILQPTMYDNFRHFLFMIPPFFIFAGVGIQAIFNRIHGRLWKSLLVCLIILPNIWALAKLHPYEYVYYNQLVGGVRGAFRHYEMDYWATSYREATDYVNAVAPSHAHIAVWGPDTLVASYARSDLEVERLRGRLDEGSNPRDLAILSTRHNKDQTLFPSDEPIFSVGRDGAIFVVVKIIH